MAMMLVWNNARSFRRHVEAMKAFRKSHYVNTINSPEPYKDMPAFNYINRPVSARARGINRISVVIPMWEIKLPKGCQN
jgi:hypothetical protein